MSYSYSKMNEYVNSLIDVFNMIRNKSLEKKDRRMHLISIMIYNYIQQLIKEHKLTEIKLNNNNGNVNNENRSRYGQITCPICLGVSVLPVETNCKHCFCCKFLLF